MYVCIHARSTQSLPNGPLPRIMFFDVLSEFVGLKISEVNVHTHTHTTGRLKRL